MVALSALPDVRANAPTDAAVLAIWLELEFVPQLELEATVVPVLLITVRLGWAKTPVTPNEVRLGPSARTNNSSLPLPPMTKPGISMLLPVPTGARVDMLISLVPFDDTS